MKFEEIKEQLLEFIEEHAGWYEYEGDVIDVNSLTEKIGKLFREVKEVKEKSLHDLSIELLRKYKKEYEVDYMIIRKGILDDVFEIVNDLKEKIEFAGANIGV